jgi:hypothetical protein
MEIHNEYEDWKRKNTEKIQEYLSVQFKANIDSINENWNKIQQLAQLQNLGTLPEEVEKHTTVLIEKVIEETVYLDEHLSLLITHFSLHLPAKVHGENGDEFHHSTCNEVLQRLKVSQAGFQFTFFPSFFLPFFLRFSSSSHI